MTPFVLGIAGGSGSGKSSLCRAFARHLKRPAQTIEQDAYYQDLSHLPLSERARTNFDHPDALDLDLLAAQLAQLRAGQPVDLPTYDFASHCRRAETRRMLPSPVLLVEGILILGHPGIRAQLDLAVFVETPGALREERRTRRDQRDRGRSLPQIERQLRETVAPMYAQFVAPSRDRADLLLQGDMDMEHNVQLLEAAAQQRGME